MQHFSLTPFGARPVSAGLLAGQALAHAPCPVSEVDKWRLFDDLRAARRRYGVSDRDLTVLHALLSFLPARMLADGAGLVVHPSNASLSERAHGMAESTLRRHLAALVTAGLIARQDSPNGKRYVARAADGSARRVYGFNLRPLLVQADRIAAAADTDRATRRELALARELVVLRLRDATKLLTCVAMLETVAAPLPDLDQVARMLDDHRRVLRRRLEAETLAAMIGALDRLCVELTRCIPLEDTPETGELDGSDSQNERHLQKTQKDSCDSESAGEEALKEPSDPDSNRHAKSESLDLTLTQRIADTNDAHTAGLPLEIVLRACPDISSYATGAIRDWGHLSATASRLAPMMGVTPETWSDAEDAFGAGQAAVCLAAMLQRIGQIRNPGGYLRALSVKARVDGFDPGAMVLSLLAAANRAPI